MQAASRARAAKYLLSLKADEFKTLYFERAKNKAEERSKRKKDGSTREVKEKDIDQLVASDRKYIREMCIELLTDGTDTVAVGHRVLLSCL